MANACVVAVVVVLGVLACISGLAGALHSFKDSDITFSSDGTCSHSIKAGLALGVIGSLCILAAQITANAAARTCICCCAKRPSAAAGQCCAIVCLVLSWLCALSSFSNLLAGGIINSSSYPASTTTVNSVVVSCAYPNPANNLYAGAIMALPATILVLVFYVKATSISANPPAYHGNVTGGVELPTAQPYPIHGYPSNPPPSGSHYV